MAGMGRNLPLSASDQIGATECPIDRLSTFDAQRHIVRRWSEGRSAVTNVRVALSLSDWLQNWLDRPSATARMDQLRRSAAEKNVLEMIEHYRHNPERRKLHGLPEVGWEDEVRRRHGGHK